MTLIIAGSRSIGPQKKEQDPTPEQWAIMDAAWIRFCSEHDLEGTFDIREVVSGMARGADLLGRCWANHAALSVKEMPADWEKHGKRAGHIRNSEMVNYTAERKGGLLAIWDGESSGTTNCIELAKAKGLAVTIYKVGVLR